MSSSDIRNVLDKIAQAGGYGRSSASMSYFLRGINHRGAGNLIPSNSDNQGLTFFTKPNLNLSYDNVARVRRLSFMATSNQDSLANVLRCILSPKLTNYEVNSVMNSTSGKFTYSQTNTGNDSRDKRTTLVDDRQAFITPLTNSLISLSGWPDFQLESLTTAEGMRKESMAWVDSVADNYTTFDLQANFQNMDGDPITILFATWMEYASRVAEGVISPYLEMIIENEIDYNTRIYRIILDPSRRWVRKIADVGASFPTAVPNGAPFNYSNEHFFTQDTHEIPIRFQCMGVRYNDPITVYNFNRTVELFNDSMSSQRREADMIKLPPYLLKIFNYEGYPRITEDYEFEWWVSINQFSEKLNIHSSLMSSLVGYNAPNQSDLNDIIAESEALFAADGVNTATPNIFSPTSTGSSATSEYAIGGNANDGLTI